MKKIYGYVAGVIVALLVLGFAATSITSANSRKGAKAVSTSERIALCSKYYKNNRSLTFKNGRKSSVVTLLNGKKQCVKKFDVMNNGKFTIKLTQKQAKNLSKCSTFKFSVAQKGYKTYTHTAPVCGTTAKTAADTASSSSSSSCN